MNDEVKAQENPCEKKADEIAKVILSESITNQNEIFERLRMVLIAERKDYITKLQLKSEELSEQMNYAGNSMEKILKGEIK